MFNILIDTIFIDFFYRFLCLLFFYKNTKRIEWGKRNTFDKTPLTISDNRPLSPIWRCSLALLQCMMGKKNACRKETRKNLSPPKNKTKQSKVYSLKMLDVFKCFFSKLIPQMCYSSPKVNMIYFRRRRNGGRNRRNKLISITISIDLLPRCLDQIINFSCKNSGRVFVSMAFPHTKTLE